MGVSFGFSGVELLSGGKVDILPDRDLRCRDHLRQLPTLLDSADGGGSRRATKAFPWYFKAFDWESGREPTTADCARPKDVLAGVHALERELQQNPKRFPAEWKLWVQQPDGTECQRNVLNGLYRGKACRLFTDAQGAWAVETDSPLAFPIHYPLGDLREVSIVVPDGSTTPVRIESISPLAVHEELFTSIKRVCILAMQREVLLLPSVT